jgi:hypothetical protein
VPRTHQFLLTLTVHTNKINPAMTPSRRSATSMTNRQAVVATPRDAQHVATAIEHDTQPTPNGLIALTVNEFRRLFDALLLVTRHTMASLLAWSRWRRQHQYRARQSHYRRREHQ